MRGAMVETSPGASKPLARSESRRWFQSVSAWSRAPRTAYIGRKAIALIAGSPAAKLLFQLKRRAAEGVLLLHQPLKQCGKELAVGPGERCDGAFVRARRALIRPSEKSGAAGRETDQAPAAVRRIDPYRHMAALQ